MGPKSQMKRSSQMRLSALEVATYGLLAAVALIFGYIEALFPLPVPVPGVKLGLGNVVVLYALASFGWRPGLLVMLVKVGASALLFGNPTVFAYSLAGALASFAGMAAALRWWRALSIVGVSMLGGVLHMVGQCLVVSVVLAPYVALAYLPVLVIAGLVTGLLTGYVCRLVIRATGRSSLFRRRRKELEKASLASRRAEKGGEATEAVASPGLDAQVSDRAVEVGEERS